MTEADVKQLILSIVKPLVSEPEAIAITTAGCTFSEF